jgi:hypothetical protein
MGKRGEGYGSEDHFLRYCAERSEQLNAAVLSALNAGTNGSVEWVYPTGAPDEREPEGLDFLTDREDVLARWKEYWPQRGRAQTWDGIAKLHRGKSHEWLLVEAKANTVEFVTPPCGASKDGGRDQIEKTLNRLKAHLGVHRHFPWLGTYYQYANRLAVLHLLNDLSGVPTQLLHIYFAGDCFPDGRECPSSAAQWRRLIEARRLTLGLPEHHALSDRTHEVFLPVLRALAPTATSGAPTATARDAPTPSPPPRR